MVDCFYAWQYPSIAENNKKIIITTNEQDKEI
jgi:hypothetical protein